MKSYIVEINTLVLENEAACRCPDIRAGNLHILGSDRWWFGRRWRVVSGSVSVGGQFIVGFLL